MAMKSVSMRKIQQGAIIDDRPGLRHTIRIVVRKRSPEKNI